MMRKHCRRSCIVFLRRSALQTQKIANDLCLPASLI